ncbi:MAG: hypothetical protein U0Y08_06130 [Bacteroidia bacterium]
MTNDTLNLGGDTLEITGTAGFNGGLITNGVCYPQATGLLSFAGTTFGAEVKAKGQIKLNGSTFNSTAYFEHIGSAAGTGTGGNTFNGPTTLKNTGTSVFKIASTYNDTFNDDVIIANAGASGAAAIQISGGANCYFNGNMTISATTVSGLTFGVLNGATYLASGKTISIGSAGLVGTLLLKNFTQYGNNAQTLSFSGVFNMVNSTFNGNLTVMATNNLLSTSSFHGQCSFTKTGSSTDIAAGGNHFYENVTFTNNATNTAAMRMASTDGDIFEKDITCNTTTGYIQLAYADTTDIYGNISINNTKANFNSGTGYTRFVGSATQTLTGSANYSIGKFIIHKTAGNITLAKQVTVDSLINLTKGHIASSTTNLLVVKASCTLSGGTNESYIKGPLLRYGSTTFTYPLGSDEKFRPITVSGSNVSTDALKLQFVDSAVQNPTNCDTTVTLNSCESWKVEYLANSKNRIFTITWDSLSCATPRNSEIIISGWNGSTWKNLGKSTITGGYLQGTVTSNDSAASTIVCLGTLKNSLTVDSVQLGELLEYSLYTNDSIILNEDIISVGKVGADYINHSVSTEDSVLTNFSGSTAMASNSLVSLLATLNSLTKSPLDTVLLNNGTLSNGIYETNADLSVNSNIALDSTKRYIIFVKGKLVLDSSCVFSSKINPSRNVLFITDSLIVDKNSFVSASFISFNEFTQIGEMRSSKLSVFSPNNILIRNDSTDFLEYAAYFHPNYISSQGGCTNLPIGCNLVLNPGFSQRINNPMSWGGIAFGDCCNWDSPTLGTSDYFNQAGGPIASVPTQTIGNSTATQLDNGIYTTPGVPAYAGIITWNNQAQSSREYLQGNLSISLGNQQYYGEFYTSLWDGSRFSANRIGMFISQNAPSSANFGVLAVTPQIFNNTNIANSTGWTLVNGCFPAQGGENFVTIGNFFTNAQTTSVPVTPVPPFPNQNAYYLIDDVSVLPIEVNAGVDVTVTCNGSTQLGGINCLESLSPGQFTYSWSLISGNLAFGSLSSQSAQLPTFTANNTSPNTYVATPY